MNATPWRRAYIALCADHQPSVDGNHQQSYTEVGPEEKGRADMDMCRLSVPEISEEEGLTHNPTIISYVGNK